MSMHSLALDSSLGEVSGSDLVRCFCGGECCGLLVTYGGGLG
jgi:hypothetical protein